jgi:predicted HNH restriction endonuclease
MTSKEKNVFRTHKVWKEFCKQVKLSRTDTKGFIECDCCGIKSKKRGKFTVHHMFKDDYTLLEIRRFACLCSTCHKFLHTKINYFDNIISYMKTVSSGRFWH